MMNNKIISLLLVILICFAYGCYKNERIIKMSPDNTTKLIAYSKDKAISFEIYSGDRLLFKENTSFSTLHKWSIDWVDNNRILLKSSDVGSFYWIRKTDTLWERKFADRVSSPDGKFVLAASWISRKDNTVELLIGTPNPMFDSISVLHTISTNAKVKDIEGCVSWDKQDTISLKAIDKTYYWQQQADETWKEIPAPLPAPDDKAK